MCSIDDLGEVRPIYWVYGRILKFQLEAKGAVIINRWGASANPKIPRTQNLPPPSATAHYVFASPSKAGH